MGEDLEYNAGHMTERSLPFYQIEAITGLCRLIREFILHGL